jgi:hypothetical protein
VYRKRTGVGEMSQNGAGTAYAKLELKRGEMARRVGLAFACACLALGVVAASASAAASWLPPTDISGVNELIDGRPKVAVDPAGNAVAIWERHVGGKEVVEASERPAGGEWSTPERLSRANEEGQGSQVAIDEAGNAFAVWVVEGTSVTFVIRTAVRPPGGEWSVPENLSAPFQDTTEAPQVALAAAAAGAVAAWTINDGFDRIVQAAVHLAGGDWSDPKDLSDAAEDARSPDVGINAAGEAVAVWQRFDGSNDIVQAAALPPGGEWSEPEDLSEAGQNAHEPQVAIDPDGDAVATWSRWDGSDMIVQAAERAAGDDWSAPDDLSEAGLLPEAAPVAIDAAGNAVAVWRHSGVLTGVLQAAVRPAGGEWSEPDDLSAPGQNAVNPAVATNGAVGAVAAWQLFDGAEYRVQASVRPPGGEWSEPENLSAAGEDAGLPDLALDAAGNGIAVFGRAGDDGPFAQAAGYDFVGPRLDALQIPATGTAGEPIAFSVSPFDMFLAGTSWTFGDGQGASGSVVSHTYSAAGTYPVTVSAVDGAGNATTRTAAIVITPSQNRRLTALSLRIEKKSLRSLRRSGTLAVVAAVDSAASATLNGRVRLRAQGKARARLVPIFVPQTVRFAAAGEQRVRLTLSERGRKTLRPLTKARIRVEGEASDLADSTATDSVARTLRD